MRTNIVFFFTLLLTANAVWSQDTLQKSTTGASTAERDVSFQNTTKAVAKLVWVDFDGKEVAFTDIAAGAKVEASSQCGHLWRVKQNGHTLKNFRVMESQQQSFVIKLPSTVGKTPTLKKSGTVPKLKQPTSGKTPPPPSTITKKLSSPPPRPVAKKSSPSPPPRAMKKSTGPPPTKRISGVLPPPPGSKGPMFRGKLPVPDERAAWRDVEQSTFQKQPDGSWMLSARGVLADVFGQYQRFTEKTRTQFAVQLTGANGQIVQLYDGTMLLTDPETRQLTAGLPGEWTHESAQVPLKMQFWKGSKDGMTVTRQPNGSWLYFKPGAAPYVVDAVIKDNRAIIFEDPIKHTSFMLCRGIALMHDEATGSYKPMTTGDWVSTEKK